MKPLMSPYFIIDNGSHTVKYNWSNMKPFIRPNVLYKIKNTFSFQPSKESYVKKTFVPEHNLIMNYDVLEGTIDSCLEECGKNTDKFDLIFTTGLTTPKIIKKDLIEIFIEIYNINKLQLGLDSIYSFLHNIKNPQGNNIIISCSHSETHLLKLDTFQSYQLPYGGERARNYLYLLNNKQKETNSFNIKVAPTGYRTTIHQIINDLKKGKLTRLESYDDGNQKSATASEELLDEKQSVAEKIAKSRHAHSLKPEEKTQDSHFSDSRSVETDFSDDTDRTNQNENNDSDEESSDQQFKSDTDVDGSKGEDNKNDSDAIGVQTNSPDDKAYSETRDGHRTKEEKRNKMVYFSALYRFKSKIEKTLSEMRQATDDLENDHFKFSQPKKYLEYNKNEFEKLKLSVEKRKNLERLLDDKKSRESVIYNRFYNFNENQDGLTNDEIEILHMIENLPFISEDESKMHHILTEILQLDSTYMEHLTIFEILNGYTLDSQGPIENLSVYRAGEAFFQPSVMECEIPGLSELIQNCMNDTDNQHEKATRYSRYNRNSSNINETLKSNQEIPHASEHIAHNSMHDRTNTTYSPQPKNQKNIPQKKKAPSFKSAKMKRKDILSHDPYQKGLPKTAEEENTVKSHGSSYDSYQNEPGQATLEENHVKNDATLLYDLYQNEPLRIPQEDKSIGGQSITEIELLHLVPNHSKSYPITIFVTGGSCQLPGFLDRIKYETQMNTFPSQQPIFIRATDPILDPFHGAQFTDYFPTITRDIYEEYGTEHFY